MIKKIAISVIALSISMIGFVGCFSNPGGSEVDSSGDKKQIIMGTNAEFAPFEYREGKDVVGFDVDLSKKIAENLGKELKIEDMEFGGLLAALETGKVDFIAAGMSKTPDRAEQVDFSKPYFTASQMITVKAGNTDIASGDDLVGKKIGVQLGTTGEEVAREIEDAEVISFDKGAMALVDLANGKLDAVVLDAEPTKNYTEGNDELQVLEEELTNEEYSIAVRKGDKELLDAINKTIDEMKENGEFEELFHKYFEE